MYNFTLDLTDFATKRGGFAIPTIYKDYKKFFIKVLNFDKNKQ